MDGGTQADTIYGGDGTDVIHGGDGDDRIFGEGTNDELYGDAGNDIIDGGAQGDIIRGGDGDDVIDGDLANDQLYGELGNDVLIGGAGTNTSDGGPGTDACSGTGCELPAMTLSGCTQDSQCATGTRCVAEIGLCLGCLVDQDGDGSCDGVDGCPTGASKTAPGICGCGISDADGDSDGTPNCNDGCPTDAAKTAAGACGCGISAQLTSLAALSNLTSVDAHDPQGEYSGPQVFNNPQLPACFVWQLESQVGRDCGYGPPNLGFTRCNSNLGTGSCGELPPDFDCVPGAQGPGVYDGDIAIGGYTGGDFEIDELGGLTCVTGDLSITNATGVYDLQGLSSLQAVGGRLELFDNDDLTSVDGLENLWQIGEALEIATNDQLTNLAGLANLSSLGPENPGASTTLYVFDNAPLAACWVDALEAHTDVQCGYMAWDDQFVACSGNDGTDTCE